jgi:hypothetical protein
LEFVINRVAQANAGSYVCEAINMYGGERENVTIKVLSAPKVRVVPDTMTLREGQEVVLHCVVEGGDRRNISYSWIDPDGTLIANVRISLKFFIVLPLLNIIKKLSRAKSILRKS